MHKEQYSKLNVMGIAANPSAVRYFVDLANDQVYLFNLQAIQLTAVQDVDVTLHVLSDFRSMLQMNKQ